MSDAEINEFQEEFIKEHGDPNGAAKRIFEAVKASKKATPCVLELCQ